MSNNHQINEDPGYAYTLSRALFWTAVIALSAYIAVAGIRVSNLVPSTPYVNSDERKPDHVQ